MNSSSGHWNRVQRWKAVLGTLNRTALRSKFISAIGRCHWAMIEACVKEGIDINCHTGDHVTALHLASDNGNIALVEFLLQQPGIKINVRDFRWETPLAIACRSGNEKVVTILLEAGADTELRDRRCNTPLHHAVMAKSYKIVKDLLDKEAELDAKNAFEKTPVYLATIDRPEKSIVQLLIDYGANLDARSFYMMPLFLECCLYCRSLEQIDMIRLLLDNGVNVNTTEPFAHRNCLHIVGITGYEPLSNFLISNGAKRIKDNTRLFTEGSNIRHKSRMTFKFDYIGQIMSSVESLTSGCTLQMEDLPEINDSNLE